MSKYLKIFLFTMLAIAMLASTAMAGVTKVNHGAPNGVYQLSLEAMGAARNVKIIDGTSANAPIYYRTTQDLTSGNFAQVSLTGAAFTGEVVRVCRNESAAAGNQIGTGTPPSGSTSYNFQLTWAANDLPAGNTFYFTTDAACNGGGKGSGMNVQISSSTSAGTPSVSISVVSAGNLAVDPTSSAQLARIRQEYTAALNAAGNATVDYLGTPGDGTRLLQGGAAGNLYARVEAALNVEKVTNDFGAFNGTAGNAGLTVGTNITVADSLAWQGISKVFIGTGAGCTDNAAGNIVGVANPSGTVNLVVPAASFNASSANNYRLCAIANGNVLTQPRTFTGTPKVNVSGAGAQDQTAGSSATIHTWDTNAYQAYMPWGVNSSAVPTYCFITNNDASKNATIITQITSSENKVVLSGATLGALPANGGVMATLTNNSISIPGGTAYDITGLGADKRYAARFTVTNNPNSVTMTCNQTDPVSGTKRAVPVLSNSANWRQ